MDIPTIKNIKIDPIFGIVDPVGAPVGAPYFTFGVELINLTFEGVKKIIPEITEEEFTKYQYVLFTPCYQVPTDVEGTVKLVSVNDELIEGTWFDTYWGVCDGKGKNKLSKLLMKVRDEIKGQN